MSDIMYTDEDLQQSPSYSFCAVQDTDDLVGVVITDGQYEGVFFSIDEVVPNIDEENDQFSFSFKHSFQGFPERFTADDIKNDMELNRVIATIIKELVINSIEEQFKDK